jgi:electron transfer flavoprotein alpha subunit
MVEQPTQRPDGILVFSETAEVLAELLTAGRELAATVGGQVVALIVGGDEPAVRDSLARGASEALVAGKGAPEPIGAEALVAALAAAVREIDPGTVLVGATRTGAEVAARLAQTLALPCASECTSFAAGDGGALVVERRVYGGRFVARQLLTGRPRLLTVPLKRFARAPTGSPAPNAAIRELAVTLPEPRVRAQSVAPRGRSEVDVTKAEIIVAAGRGVRRVEDLALLEQLAQALGGVLAGSRPLTGDLDWLPVDRRIGLSGQTVKPNLYIAGGISGQIEHVVGIKGARTVVAINNDPKAPIHAEADYSVVGDLYEIVPALMAACERARSGR